MLVGFIQLSSTRVSGPAILAMWKSPFAAWVTWLAKQLSAKDDELLTAISTASDADARSVVRWIAGDPIEKLRYPLRPCVEACIEIASKQSSVKLLNHATGWLTIAIALQSLSEAERSALQQHARDRRQHPWALEDAIETLQTLAYKAGEDGVRHLAIPTLQDIGRLFADRPLDIQAINARIEAFASLFADKNEHIRRRYQYLHDGCQARLAAMQGDVISATQLYRNAVSGCWWCAGSNQKLILEEALLYAVGVGDQVAAKHYWDKTFLLGLNNLPKRELDEQERRRLAFGFQRMFYPQKANDRVLLGIEIVDGEFKLDAKALRAPNRKMKFADGRTRRTPFMDTIMRGTLAEVRQMLAAGGDVNTVIPESGEGPLLFALQRARNQKDPAILHEILRQPLTKDTVNRPAGTGRETPLQIANEMADREFIRAAYAAKPVHRRLRTLDQRRWSRHGARCKTRRNLGY
ncbi:MAG: hypothetical protein H0V62_07015 [Gammaproteobacteria bacterium]|nr:hypothetical protein [Gammaproteobacteria bacterium]